MFSKRKIETTHKSMAKERQFVFFKDNSSAWTAIGEVILCGSGFVLKMCMFGSLFNIFVYLHNFSQTQKHNADIRKQTHQQNLTS